MYSYGNNIFFLEPNIYIVDQKQVLYTLFQKRKYSRYRMSNVVVSIRGVHCPSIDREYTFSCDSSEKSSWSSRKLKSSRIDSWVKSQLYRSAYIYVCTFIYIDDNRTLKWDTMCMKLYCSPESVGQFGPSADQAIVCHTYTIIKCIGIVYKNFRVNVSQGSIRIFFVRSNPPRRTFLQNLLFIEQSDLLVVLSIY